jgi:phospholipase/carboxylesterase
MKTINIFLISVIFVLIYANPTPEDTTTTLLDENPFEYYRSATADYQAGDFQSSIDNYFLFLEKFRRNSTILYNIACNYSLLNKPEKAIYYLEKAVEAGFENLELATTDADLQNVRNNDKSKIRYQQIIKRVIDANDFSQQEQLIHVPNYPVKFEIVKPKDFNKDKKYKLVIGLHGSHGKAKNFIRQIAALKEPAIYVTMNAPYATRLGLNRYGYIWNSKDRDYFNSLDSSVDYVKNFIETFHRKYEVEETILFGFSQGAYLAMQTAVAHPDLCEKVVAIGGRIPDKIYKNKQWQTKSLPHILLAVGNQESVEDIKATRAQQRYLEKINQPVKLEIYKGPHILTDDILDKARKWIF